MTHTYFIFLRLIKQYYLNCAFSHLCLHTQVQFREHRQNESKRKHAEGAPINIETLYKGFPIYAVFTTEDPTTAIFGLCTRKWGIFALVGDPIQSY